MFFENSIFHISIIMLSVMNINIIKFILRPWWASYFETLIFLNVLFFYLYKRVRLRGRAKLAIQV